MKINNHRDLFWFPHSSIAKWVIDYFPGSTIHEAVPAYKHHRTLIIVIDTNTRSSVPAEHAFLASESFYREVIAEIGTNPLYHRRVKHSGFIGQDSTTYQFITLGINTNPAHL
jgi:hypothetical protein